ncbi:MAG: YcaQ family DNA glycosylase [Phycisphaerae bacterium]|nr:YcaQ family DNA glycosylase [Phycisphaerae bacterium]
MVRTRAATSVPLVSTEQAARMVLATAGLATPRVRSSAAQVARVVKRLGYVQVDSILAVERAHDTILRTRLEGYRGEHLRHAMERDRAMFEHWTHDASLVPIEWLPFWHRRFKRSKARMKENAWWRERAGEDGDRVLRRVFRAIERRGPLRTRDLVDPSTSPAARPEAAASSGAWWNWSPEKAAVEWLWRMGRVAISQRHGFEKSYDLFERVHPEHALPAARAADHREWACSEALMRLGVATEREIARFFNDCSVAEVQAWSRTRAARALAMPVLRERADGGPPEPALALRTIMDCPPDAPQGIRILSPFDPVVRDRQRLERVWGFAFRFEAFVPEAKRIDGYYTLPVLADDRFIGRCALRTDRAGDRLVLERWRSERATGALPRPVRAALQQFAQEIGVSEVAFRAPRRTLRA